MGNPSKETTHEKPSAAWATARSVLFGGFLYALFRVVPEGWLHTLLGVAVVLQLLHTCLCLVGPLLRVRPRPPASLAPVLQSVALAVVVLVPAVVAGWLVPDSGLFESPLLELVLAFVTAQLVLGVLLTLLRIRQQRPNSSSPHNIPGAADDPEG
jgi:hypothetical protein